MEQNIGLISWDIETSIRSIEEYFGVEVNDENLGKSTISGEKCNIKAIDSDTIQENLDIAFINLLWEEDQESVDPVMSRYENVPIKLYLTRNPQNIAKGWKFNAQIVSINGIYDQILRSVKDLSTLHSILRRFYQELVDKSYSEVQALMGDLQGDARELMEIGNLSFEQFWAIWRQRPRDKG